MRYALGLIALLPVLQTHADPRREGAARPEESAPAKLEERLKSLADKHVDKERPSRDPAMIRVQIGRPKEGLHNLLRERIAALRGVGFGRFASHRLRRCEPTPQLRCRSLA